MCGLRTVHEILRTVYLHAVHALGDHVLDESTLSAKEALLQLKRLISRLYTTHRAPVVPWPPHRWLGLGHLKLAGEHPLAVGGFTDVLYEATHNSRKVVLKLGHRCASFHVARVVAVRYNHICVQSTLSAVSLAQVSQ